MLFFQDDKDYKTLTSALRRELKAIGIGSPTHNQLLEVLSRSLGHDSWAALQVAHRRRPAQAAGAATVLTQGKASPSTYDDEMADLRDDAAHEGYRLFNDSGELDLSLEGSLVSGLGLDPVEGTLDDIFCCIAGVSAVERCPDGTLDLGYTGDTKVNWDGQDTRQDSRGNALWWLSNGHAIAQDRCIVAPEDFGRGADLLDEELMAEHSLPNRKILVNAVFRWLKDQDKIGEALGAMPFDAALGVFEPDFFDNSESFFTKVNGKVSAIGAAQIAAGFRLHLGEFRMLRERLQAEYQPTLF